MKSFHCAAQHRSIFCRHVVLFILSLVNYTCAHSEVPLLLLVSFDGFRWDYLQIANRNGFETPNFNRLIKNGVIIGDGGLKNTFVTKTLPNHYSLVTGLHAENHGIVGNNFFDPVFNETFTYGFNLNIESRKWWDGLTGTNKEGAEPIWVTNDRRGGQHVSGSYQWPGSIVDHQRPFYTRCGTKHSMPVNITEAIDTIVEWFMDSIKPMNLGLLYFGEPDRTGHRSGAGSMEVLKKIEELDHALGFLLTLLESHNLFDKMNIILTSDHGMTNLTQMIYLDEYVDPKSYFYFGGSPVFNIQPIEGKEENVYNAFKAIPNVTIYKREDIPKEYHYSMNRRILTYFVTVPEGFQICNNRNNSACNLSGNHGYNNSLPSMHPIFIAHGPAFKKNYTSKPFNSVDLYPLMCHILHIPAHSNDGNLDNIRHIMAEDFEDETDRFSESSVTVLIYIGFAALISIVFCFAAFRLLCIFRRNRGRFSIRRFHLERLDFEEKGGQNLRPLLGSEEEEDCT